MITPVTFIYQGRFDPGDLLPEENIYCSILVDPLSPQAMENAYALIGSNGLPICSLTLTIQDILTPESIRSITSFLFLPSYIRVGGRAVINLTGGNVALVNDALSHLNTYFSAQGFPDLALNVIPPEKIHDGTGPFLTLYKESLYIDRGSDRMLFYCIPDGQPLRSLVTALHQLEEDCRKNSPDRYSLLLANRKLESELLDLRTRQTATEKELANQRQYVDILRSDHSTRELQDYYNNEYEILPLWYKRFGHILKVFAGKRTFRSLFRDNVKKYKD